MIELVIAVVPVILLFLAVAQLALLGAAQLVVQHAAICGARSAAVVLDDDRRFYAGSVRGELDLAGAMNQDSPRLAVIRRAVHAPLCAIAPEPRVVRALLRGTAKRTSVARAVGGTSSARFTSEAERYLPLATALAFPLEPGSDELAHGMMELGDQVSVRVSHLVPCTVPIVGYWVCEHLDWDAKEQRLRTASHADRKLARALDELRLAPDAFRQVGFAHAHLPVAVLHAEATFPLQRAPYKYLSERPRLRDEAGDEP